MPAASYGHAQIPLSEVAEVMDPHLPRNPGYHVSDLIAEMDVIGKVKRARGRDDDEESGLMSLGRIWEVAARQWLDQYSRGLGLVFTPSVKLEKDGIIGNLDGTIGSELGTVAVAEIKLTTTKDPSPESKWKWITQVRSYCYMDPHQPLCAWFLVLQIPRTGSPDAVFNFYTHTFTYQELAENWQMLLNMRDYLRDR